MVKNARHISYLFTGSYQEKVLCCCRFYVHEENGQVCERGNYQNYPWLVQPIFLTIHCIHTEQRVLRCGLNGQACQPVIIIHVFIVIVAVVIYSSKRYCKQDVVVSWDSTYN